MNTLQEIFARNRLRADLATYRRERVDIDPVDAATLVLKEQDSLWIQKGRTWEQQEVLTFGIGSYTSVPLVRVEVEGMLEALQAFLHERNEEA